MVAQPDIDFVSLAVVFILATLLGFASHAPGSIGVFDAAMLVALPDFGREQLLDGEDGGFSKRSITLADLTLTRLPESSSICIELSASDITRPAWNLPASSNNAYIGRIVAARAPTPEGWARR